MSLTEISFVIASNHPRELAQFYSLAIQKDVVNGFDSSHCLINIRKGLSIQFYKPSLNRPWPDRGKATSICFHKEADINPCLKIKEWCSNLVELGGEVIDSPKIEAFGAEAWIADPEGNEFLIFVPGLSNMNNPFSNKRYLD